MGDRPILFSAPMVRALLEGRKTQTRRVIKPQPEINVAGLWVWPPRDHLGGDGKAWARRYGGFCQTDDEGLADFLSSRPGRQLPAAPGDRLWVREAWRVGAWNHCDGGIAVDYLADAFARKEWLYHPDYADEAHRRLIKQSRDDARKAGLIAEGATWEYRWSPGNSPCRVRSPIHMPRWASRLTLTVTHVRVQRLQEISEVDAWAEGCKPGDLDDNGNPFPAEEPHPKGGTIGWDCARDWYADLWDSLHGPDAWDRNDWVCALTFTVQRGNIDQIGGGNG